MLYAVPEQTLPPATTTFVNPAKPYDLSLHPESNRFPSGNAGNGHRPQLGFHVQQVGHDTDPCFGLEVGISFTTNT